jgi:hypothetical protein
MSDYPPTPPEPASGPAPGWWQASDGNWYPPDQRPGYGAPPPSAYGTPPGYGQPTGYGYGYTMPVAKSTNGMATAALILGCAQFFLWILSGIPAIICGHIALSQIKRTGQEGRGMAIAGLVLGYIGLVLFLAFILLIVVAADEIDSDGFRIESGVVRW